MNKLKVLFALIVYATLSLSTCPVALAQGSNSYITIVNPVRVSSYSKSPSESIDAEYRIVKKYNLPATWLLTYDALSDKNVMSKIFSMDNRQEFGIFLEVTPAFASDSGVKYNDTGFWQHASSVFLSGYTQEERKKLIDKVFEKYKENFGKYPKSIGSWWTDAYSLNYIKEKYGVVGNLVCSDQFSTDGYQIWGTPWQAPYYPSKNHPAVSASSLENKLDVVNIQWAARDPIRGYESSLFSTQDYLVVDKNLTIDYFKKLVDLYTSTRDDKNFRQITVGLEADLNPEGYGGEYQKQIEYVSSLKKGGIGVVTMSDFADLYRKKFSGLSPVNNFDSVDLLGAKLHSFWVSSSNYRLFYIKNDDKNIIQIKDLRIYNPEISDPYNISPNKSFNLSINIPAVIDSVERPGDVWELPYDTKIKTSEEKIELIGRNIKIPDRLKDNPLIDIKTNGDQVEISFMKNIVSKDGVELKDYSSEALHFFKQKRAVLFLLSGKGWNYFRKVTYSIPQGEIYSLYFLKSLPKGDVLVYQNECLQCEYHTILKPPAFSGLKSYVKKYSGKEIAYNRSVFEAKTRETAKSELKKSGAEYVYLVKFEGYSEELPFSPGDLGVEKIFSNANSEIWRVK